MFKLLRKNKILKPVQLWNDINEMWLHNWEQLNISGDVKWLCVFKKDWEKKINPETIEAAFFQIHDQYSAVSGHSDTMDKYRILCLALLEANTQVVKDKSLINYIRSIEAQIDVLMKSEGNSNVIKDRMIIQKLYGQKIDPHSTTVAEYLNIIEVVNEMNAVKNNTNGAD